MNIPTVPTFVTGETSLVNLQSLSAAVSMACVASSFPMWRYYKTATQSLTANTWNQIAMGTSQVDTDGLWTTPGFVTIKTQGYYECESCIPFTGSATPFLCEGAFLVTAGANNTHHTVGATLYFGGFANWAKNSTAGIDAVYNMSGMCPWVLFPGDTISVQVYPLAATTLTNGTNGSNTSGWFPAQFSGKWISVGS